MYGKNRVLRIAALFQLLLKKQHDLVDVNVIPRLLVETIISQKSAQ